MNGMRLRRCCIAASGLVIGMQTAVAGNSFYLIQIAKEIADILMIILGMSSLIELAIVIYSVMKGDRDQVDKGIKWFLITALVFVVMDVMKHSI